MLRGRDPATLVPHSSTRRRAPPATRGAGRQIIHWAVTKRQAADRRSTPAALVDRRPAGQAAAPGQDGARRGTVSRPRLCGAATLAAAGGRPRAVLGRHPPLLRADAAVRAERAAGRPTSAVESLHRLWSAVHRQPADGRVLSRHAPAFPPACLALHIRKYDSPPLSVRRVYVPVHSAMDRPNGAGDRGRAGLHGRRAPAGP